MLLPRPTVNSPLRAAWMFAARVAPFALQIVVHAVGVGADAGKLRPAGDEEAVKEVGQGGGAGGVGADVVAGHHVGVTAAALDVDAAVGVARDDVALGGVEGVIAAVSA